MSDTKAIGYLQVTALLAALTNSQNSLGKLKLMKVDPTADNYYEGEGLAQSKEELFRALIDVDDDGDFAIRIGKHTTTGSTKLPQSELTEDQILRNMIGKASDGKPYLRVAIQEL